MRRDEILSVREEGRGGGSELDSVIIWIWIRRKYCGVGPAK